MMDVLVVGGGPAGLATAIRCAQVGLQVTVAEPRAVPIDKACGEGLMPTAVKRLRAIGVHPVGFPFRGIRYLDGRHRADAFFRGGYGLGVRRTALHAALTQRAAQLAIPVVQTRVTRFTQYADRVAAAGMQARYLVAADGLHSSIRRACTLDAPPASHPRFGLRRHYRMAPWSDLVEMYWSPGPLRQDVRRRVHANVLLVGDASGYIDALTGEGISVGLAQAAALVECLQSGSVADYEQAWRRVSRKSRLLTAGLLWFRHRSLLAPHIVPAAEHFPHLFTSIVNHVAAA